MKNKKDLSKKKRRNNKKTRPEMLRTRTTEIEKNASISLSELRRNFQNSAVDHNIEVCFYLIRKISEDRHQ